MISAIKPALGMACLSTDLRRSTALRVWSVSPPTTTKAAEAGPPCRNYRCSRDLQCSYWRWNVAGHRNRSRAAAAVDCTALAG